MDNFNDPTVNVSATGAQVPTQLSTDVPALLPETQVETVNGTPIQPQTETSVYPEPMGDRGVQREAQDINKPNVPAPVVAKPEDKHGGGLFHSIMEVLAGPQFTYKVNAQTGEMERVPVKRTTGQLANAVVAGALTGLFSGMGQRGPGSVGRSAQAGFNAGMGMHEQQDQAAQTQAKENFARNSAIFETNLRQHMNAVQLGKLDMDTHNQMVDMTKSTRDALQDIPGAVVADHVPESDLLKYNATRQTALADGVVPRIGPDGKQATDKFGSPLWDNTYTVINPVQIKPPDDVLQKAVDWGLIGKSNIATPMSTQSVVGLIAKVQALEMAQKSINTFVASLEKKPAAKTAYTAPDLGNTQIQDLADKTADKYGVDKAVVRALIKAESGGDAKAVSPKGAKGVMQLMDGTAKDMGVSDPFDAAQNIDGGVKYLKQLIDKNKGDVEKALRQYHGIGSDGITTDSQYVNGIMSSIKPVAEAEEEQPKAKTESVDLKQELKDDPTLSKALQKWQRYLASGMPIDKALEAMSKNPNDAQYVGQISNLYGGPEAIAQYTKNQAAEKEATKTAEDLDKLRKEQDIKTEAALTRQERTKQADHDRIIKNNEQLIRDLIGQDDKGNINVKNRRLIDIKTMTSLRNEASRQAILEEASRRDPTFNPSEVEGKIKLFENALGAARNTSGSYANAVANANTSLGHMGTALEALDALSKSSGIDSAKILNMTERQLNDQFGTDPNWIKYIGDLRTAATDWQNLLNNQHALKEEDVKWVNEHMNPDLPLRNQMAAIGMMAHTGAVRILPLNQQWKQAFRANFPNLIQPQTVKSLSRLAKVDPEVMSLLKDLESGGKLTGSGSGAGVAGMKVSDLVDAKPVTQDGQIIGFTKDGKTMVPVSQDWD